MNDDVARRLVALEEMVDRIVDTLEDQRILAPSCDYCGPSYEWWNGPQSWVPDCGC